MFANQTTSVFGFSHALFHKALYDSLFAEERMLLHRQCFEILKTEWDALAKTQEQTLPLASKLLLHAERSDELEVAADIALTAAHGAWRTYAEAEALEMLGHVKRFVTNSEYDFTEKKRDELLGEALLLRSQIDRMRGRFDDALNECTSSFEHFERLNDKKKATSSLNERANVLYRQGAYELSESEARKALMMAKDANYKLGETHALNTIGNVNDACGAYDEALEYHTRCLAVNESIGDRSGIAISLNNIGNVHRNRGAFGEALDYYNKSLKMQESIGNRYGIALVLNNVGGVYQHQGASDIALDYYSRSLKLFESIGDRLGIAGTLHNIGSAHADRGTHDKALEYYKQSLEMCESAGNQYGVVLALVNIGVTHREQGDLSNVRQFLERARTLAAEIKMKHFEATAWCELGVLSEAEAEQYEGDATRKTAKMREAMAYLEKGVGILHEINNNTMEGYERELERLKAENSE
ncbi:MAG TPA: tetratricopeptide repeat protein, partial [Candidatus Kapabacteria bacterium]|nr:tetratricopeptide repeat protein [Candidatus Kapabacteria bacterium]